MDDTCGMGLREPLRGLSQEAQERPEIRLFVVYLLFQRLTADQLHGDEVNGGGGDSGGVAGIGPSDLGLADLVDGDDVGMIQGGGGLRFLDEAPHPLLALHQLRGKDFQGDRPVQDGVLGHVDLTHAACSERRNNAIVA